MSIILQNVLKKYTNHFELKIDCLELFEGEIIAIIGNNGAGKTTFLKILLDMIEIENGNVSTFGEKVALNDNWKHFTGAYLDKSFLIDFLTPIEYIETIASFLNFNQSFLRNELNLYDEFLGYSVINNINLIRSLSEGNKHKIGILGAILFNPKVIILDEPFNYLDPKSQNLLKLKLKNENKKSIKILSSHNLENTFEIANRFILLENGKIKLNGINNKENQDFIKKYYN